MKKTNRLIVGTALSLAAIAVAIDHTQHRLPDPIPSEQMQSDESEEESPCSMDSDDSSPCGLGD